MKKLLLSLSAIALMATASFAQVKADDIAKIKVETIDLGKIPQGVPAVSTFIVTNIGKTDLIIESVNPTCGCTVGDHTKAPIAPGKTGTITATFNAAGLGPINKSMTVKFAGADDMKSIGFTGEVLDAAEYAKIKSGVPPAVVTNVPAKANVPSPKVGVTQRANKTKVKKATAKVAA
jgi:Protein of unknown function (DUF1573)